MRRILERQRIVSRLQVALWSPQFQQAILEMPTDLRLPISNLTAERNLGLLR